MEYTSRLEQISKKILTPFVGNALEVTDPIVTSWNAHLVKGGWEFPHRTVARLSGEARVPGEDGQRTWSLYLKVARKAGRSITDSISDPYQREVLLYRSGFLDDLPGGASAPRCLGIMEPDGDVPWVFLEEIKGTTYENWTLSRYGVAARHLGHLHGDYLLNRPLIEEVWANRSNWLYWQRRNALERERFALDRACTHPLTRHFYAGSLGERARNLLGRHFDFSDILCRLPLTLVHGDLHRNNLIARDGAAAKTVIIDWDFAGIAQLGIDTGTLIGTSAIFNPPLVAPLAEFVELIYEGYLAGLCEAGWKGPVDVIRFAIVGYLACIFGMGGPPLLDRVLDEESRSRMERQWNLSAEEIIERLVRTHEGLLEYGEEASELIQGVMAFLSD